MLDELDLLLDPLRLGDGEDLLAHHVHVVDGYVLAAHAGDEALYRDLHAAVVEGALDVLEGASAACAVVHHAVDDAYRLDLACDLPDLDVGEWAHEAELDEAYLLALGA